VSAVTIAFRFIFGLVLAGSVVLWIGFDFPLNVVFVLTIGTLAAIWGDKFILGCMSVMRYFR
jgi:hypothetical protein